MALLNKFYYNSVIEFHSKYRPFNKMILFISTPKFGVQKFDILPWKIT